MSSLASSSKGSWQPSMTDKTNMQSYWLNWRFLLCAIWVIVTIVLSFLLIWKYEYLRRKHARNGSRERRQEVGAILYDHETWRPCLKGIHPAWLFAFRVIAFCVLLVLLIVNGNVDGGSILYYYTQWTFISITIYFGLGSMLSIYGCYQHHKKATGDKVDNVDGDAELGTYGSNATNQEKSFGATEDLVHQYAGTWGYIFQIMFQMNAGAVMLTDCVFWFIMVPFLTIKDYNLNYLVVLMHTINAAFLIGDTLLNSLRFPWFRIGYFYLWTVTYVTFQWIVHACINIWWPYPFLDLSSRFAPLWYLIVGCLHIPCYGIFTLVMKLKHCVLSTRYPDSYQCVT
ncbi:unnamed protein product [Lupinus luteus]|uniref:Uncharacterized protein n=1 Tax=Lupinus luteus TaxID=3873 RepID=A0AAV1XG76_LUPLU